MQMNSLIFSGDQEQAMQILQPALNIWAQSFQFSNR